MRARAIILLPLTLAAALGAAATGTNPPSPISAAEAALPEALWQPLGPGGGLAVRAAVDPFTPGRVFGVWRGGQRSQVYRRDPGSAVWSFASGGLEAARPDALALHPSQPGTLWAASVLPLAIYRSTDAGASWQLRYTGRDRDQPYGFWAVPRARAATLLGWFGETIPQAKLASSRDSGATWTEIAGVRGPVAVLDRTSTVFALGADRRALVVSHDAGATWSPSGALPLDADGDLAAAFVALYPQRPVLLVSFAQTGIFRSADQGRTWRRVGPAGAGASSIVSVPPALCAAFADGLYESLDRGATWRLRPTTGFPGFVSLTAEPSSQNLYALSQERSDLSQSRDGGRTWTHVGTRGIQMFSVRDFVWHPRDPRVQVIVQGGQAPGGTVSAMQSTRDGGATWQPLPFKTFALDPSDSHILYGGSVSGVFVSRDGGEWTSLRSEPATVIAHSGEALFAGECGIAKSADGGIHWTEVLPCEAPPSAHLPSGGFLFVQRLIPHPTAPDVVWANVVEAFFLANGQPFFQSVVYATFDGGLNWERRMGFGQRIVLSPGRPDTVWDAGGSLIRSDDRGLTFRRIAVAGVFSDLAIDPLDPDRIVAVGSRAVTSHDDGRTWSRAFPWPAGQQPLGRVFLHPTLPGRIAVAPSSGGLWLSRAPL